MLLHVRKVKDEVSDVSTGMALQPLSPWPLSNVIKQTQDQLSIPV